MRPNGNKIRARCADLTNVRVVFHFSADTIKVGHDNATMPSKAGETLRTSAIKKTTSAAKPALGGKKKKKRVKPVPLTRTESTSELNLSAIETTVPYVQMLLVGAMQRRVQKFKFYSTFHRVPSLVDKEAAKLALQALDPRVLVTFDSVIPRDGNATTAVMNIRRVKQLRKSQAAKAAARANGTHVNAACGICAVPLHEGAEIAFPASNVSMLFHHECMQAFIYAMHANADSWDGPLIELPMDNGVSCCDAYFRMVYHERDMTNANHDPDNDITEVLCSQTPSQATARESVLKSMAGIFSLVDKMKVVRAPSPPPSPPSPELTASASAPSRQVPRAPWQKDVQVPFTYSPPPPQPQKPAYSMYRLQQPAYKVFPPPHSSQMSMPQTFEQQARMQHAQMQVDPAAEEEQSFEEAPMCVDCGVKRVLKTIYGDKFWGCPNWRQTRCPLVAIRPHVSGVDTLSMIRQRVTVEVYPGARVVLEDDDAPISDCGDRMQIRRNKTTGGLFYSCTHWGSANCTCRSEPLPANWKFKRSHIPESNNVGQRIGERDPVGVSWPNCGQCHTRMYAVKGLNGFTLECPTCHCGPSNKFPSALIA